jgi:hypothetical protein
VIVNDAQDPSLAFGDASERVAKLGISSVVLDALGLTQDLLDPDVVDAAFGDRHCGVRRDREHDSVGCE